MLSRGHLGVLEERAFNVGESDIFFVLFFLKGVSVYCVLYESLFQPLCHPETSAENKLQLPENGVTSVALMHRTTSY